MKLYYAPGACSLAPHIVLNELGLPHRLIRVDLKTGKTEQGDDFRAINPKGYVPALELDSGERLTEAAVILQYLADSVPAAGLAPAAATAERYRLQEWLNFIATEIHKGFSPLWNAAIGSDEKQRVVDRLGARLDWLATQLEGRDFLAGNTFGVADAYLFTVLNWGQWLGVDIARWPALKAYSARVAVRRGVRAALLAEGLLKQAA